MKKVILSLKFFGVEKVVKFAIGQTHQTTYIVIREKPTSRHVHVLLKIL